MGPDELWEEVLNGMLKRQLGWGVVADDVIRRGEKGLDGLLQFIEYFILERSVNANLLEGKLASLMERLDVMSVLIISIEN